MKFIEPCIITDVLISGVACVEIIKGGLIRFTHYVEQTEQSGEVVGIINSRIVMPLESLAEARAISMAKEFGRQPNKALLKGH